MIKGRDLKIGDVVWRAELEEGDQEYYKTYQEVVIGDSRALGKRWFVSSFPEIDKWKHARFGYISDAVPVGTIEPGADYAQTADEAISQAAEEDEAYANKLLSAARRARKVAS